MAYAIPFRFSAVDRQPVSCTTSQLRRDACKRFMGILQKSGIFKFFILLH